MMSRAISISAWRSLYVESVYARSYRALGLPSKSLVEPVKRADLSLGFTSPLDISMDSSHLCSWLAGIGKGTRGFKEGVDGYLSANRAKKP